LIPIIDAVRDGFFAMKENPEFLRDLNGLYADYVGRPSPLVYCPNISRQYGGAQLYLKNE
jgi:tryptophan synthase beta subunit